MLKDNIFGIDISQDALRLTIFSLSLVLLDALSPKEIWENLKFDNLQALGNFHDMDFFDSLDENTIRKFDLIIGNPPFVSELPTSGSRQIEAKREKERPPLPDNQLALLFLDQTIKLCKPGGQLCLILPAGPFLYNYSSTPFRTHFLTNYHVNQILDFTFLREILFENANAATVAVFAQNSPPQKPDILHAIFRRNKSAKEKFLLEIDQYHQIS